MEQQGNVITGIDFRRKTKTKSGQVNGPPNGAGFNGLATADKDNWRLDPKLVERFRLQARTSGDISKEFSKEELKKLCRAMPAGLPEVLWDAFTLGTSFDEALRFRWNNTVHRMIAFSRGFSPT